MKYINKESADIDKEINKLMALIERTTTVNDITELRDGLEDFIANYNSISTINGSIVTQNKTLDLADLIPARHVKRMHHVENIDEAIAKASDVLVANHFIDIKYIHEMQQVFDDSYMVIMQNIAIPHAYSEKHVHKTAMSMLILQEPIYMSDGTAIHIIVPIAAVDKVTHLRALLQLRDVAQDNDAIKRIIQSRKNSDVNEILKIIQIKKRGKWMGQQLVHKENIMLNLSATDKESVLSQMSDVLFQNGFVKSTFKDAVIDREKNLLLVYQRIYVRSLYRIQMSNILTIER